MQTIIFTDSFSVLEEDVPDEYLMSNAATIQYVVYLKKNRRNLCDDAIYLKSIITYL